jgi:hypothetical protein
MRSLDLLPPRSAPSNISCKDLFSVIEKSVPELAATFSGTVEGRDPGREDTLSA